MPIAADHHHASSFSALSRSIFAARRSDEVTAMDPAAAHPHDRQLDSFQRHVTAAIAAAAAAPDLLSLAWIRSLLDSFLLIHEEFRALLFACSPLVLSLPALRRSISDHLDRTVKALDLLNAVRDGIDRVKHWNSAAEIAVAALHRSLIGEGQIRRAKKSLSDLALSLSEPDPLPAAVHRNRSLAPHRRAAAASGNHHRSQSWSVSRSWSAARQLQAMGANLNAPRAAEIAGTAGLALSVYTMGSVLHLVMWALVAAIPCQDRGIQAHSSALPPPRGFAWSAGFLSVYERVSEEARKRDSCHRRNCGLLREIDAMERRSWRLMEAMEGDEMARVGGEVEGLKAVCEGLSAGLGPLERQLREVFHGIVKSRSEGLDYLSDRH